MCILYPVSESDGDGGKGGGEKEEGERVKEGDKWRKEEQEDSKK